MRAFVTLRDSPHYRREAFETGLKRLGYAVVNSLGPANPARSDVLVTWNRCGSVDEQAKRFERAGAKVVVCENGYLGNRLLGERWFAMSLSQHNGAGRWPAGDPQRWDGLGIELAPWRSGGTEIVVLMQRGIGPPGVAQPRTWRVPGRMRRHPGKEGAGPPLAWDLRNARAVATWASGSAIKALVMGIPVFYGFERWIGAQAGVRHRLPLPEPKRDDEARLAMFRRLAWAMRRESEIVSGEAFADLLGMQ